MVMQFACLKGLSLYLTASCCIIAILGLLNCFFGTPIIGLVLGISMLLLSCFGCAGAWFKTKKMLIWFMVGVGALIIFALVSVILDITKKAWASLVINLFALIFYVLCITFDFGIYADKKWKLLGTSSV